MPATKRYMNWTGVGFTPGAGTLIPITGVTDVQISNNGNNVKFSGDGDQFPTTIAHDFNDPQVRVTAADVAALLQLAEGTRGVFTATLNDAKNRTGTGAITFTVAGAIVRDRDFGGRHRQFAGPTIMFDAESADGLTSPVSTAIAV